MAYRGDIYALERDSVELIALGVKLGAFNRRYRCFENCIVRPEVMRRLQVLGNKYLWDLAPLAGARMRSIHLDRERRS